MTESHSDFLRAFIWTSTEGMKRIDPLQIADHVSSQATGINQRGHDVASGRAQQEDILEESFDTQTATSGTWDDCLRLLRYDC